MASNQHYHPTTTNSLHAQRSNYKVLQRHHQCPTNMNRHWGNQGLSGSHVKLLAVGRKWAMPNTSQWGAPRPSPKRKRMLGHIAWTKQAQISIGALLGWAIIASKSWDGLQGQTQAQGMVLGTWKTRKDREYWEEPLPRQKDKISLEIRDRCGAATTRKHGQRSKPFQLQAGQLVQWPHWWLWPIPGVWQGIPK